MTAQKSIPEDRVTTGIKHLDALLNGGLPRQSVTVVGGTPGAGKTILSQQICFRNASPESPVLFVQTLSEPTAKTLRYLKQFTFFDPRKLEDGSVKFVDLGGIIRSNGLERASSEFMSYLRSVKPAYVVIDSFKVFGDLAKSAEELRKFTYEMAIHLMAWECTSFLLGEFTASELQSSPLSSIVDGIIMLTGTELSGEQQRFLQVVKMRGTSHDLAPHPFAISETGIEIYAPGLEVGRDSVLGRESFGAARGRTGIASLDALIGEGVQQGASILVSGPAGTGKTSLGLEALYQGASQFGDKGIYFSFDESSDKLRAAAQNLGLDLEKELKRERIQIVSIPQSEILVEKHLLMIGDLIMRFGAKRVVIDTLSSLFHKIKDARIAREKIYQLAALVRGAGAMGFMLTDAPFNGERISDFGVEESLLDGVILLSLREQGLERERFLEIYKLRSTQHRCGRYPMAIGRGGITVDSRRTSPKTPVRKKPKAPR